MAFLWDYDKQELSKKDMGKVKILERSINYGPDKGEKIKLSQVKRFWSKLSLFPNSKRLFELLIWGKYRSLPKIKKTY